MSSLLKVLRGGDFEDLHVSDFKSRPYLVASANAASLCADISSL